MALVCRRLSACQGSPASADSSDCVQVFVDVLGNRLNLSAQLVLDLEHVVLVVFGDKIDGETEVAKSS